MPTPTPQGSQAVSEPTVAVTVAEIVFAWRELNANGKQTMRMIANHTPSHRAFSPRCM